MLSHSPIRKLSIGSGDSTFSCNWEKLSWPFRLALYRIFESPLFRELTLINVGSVPSHLPTHFPNIQQLALSPATFSRMTDEWVSNQTNWSRKPSKLQHLVLGFVNPSWAVHIRDQTTDWMSNLDMSQLHSLTLSLPVAPFRDLAPLLQLQRLKVLHVQFRYPLRPYMFGRQDQWKMNLQGLTSLEELTFRGPPMRIVDTE
ncbi:hypothetical protein BDN72DRAFT_849713 [Pluteus cervinus]|uniref:Uncharacterized protein n=1 Tax=Pluteus cervinus TaxID=181527 RepID=A0ACD3A9A8_9AGAR|nr:hypothetical protein BDN72DRAFT_849713 [Pluteus cervinus]